MSLVGEIKKKTQQRIVVLFRDTLGYAYLGDSIEREGTRNIEPAWWSSPTALSWTSR